MDKQKDLEKGWEEYKAKRKHEQEEMISIIQSAVGGCARNWASLIAEEVLKYYQPKTPAGAVVLTREEHDELKKGVKTYNYTAMFKAQDAYRWEQGYLQGCKETAEKFAERLKSDHSGIESDREGDHLIIVVDEDELDEICKEFTEGQNEGKET